MDDRQSVEYSGSQMRMSVLTGAKGDIGPVPVTSMVYAPGARPSISAVMGWFDGRRMRVSTRVPVSLVTDSWIACGARWV